MIKEQEEGSVGVNIIVLILFTFIIGYSSLAWLWPIFEEALRHVRFIIPHPR